MKRLLISLLSLSLASMGMAFEVSPSSYTATDDSLKIIEHHTGGARSLVAVIVSSPTALGTITIYDSSGTATGKIGTIHCGTVQDPSFNVRLSSGLTYSSLGCSNGVTIIYKKR